MATITIEIGKKGKKKVRPVSFLVCHGKTKKRIPTGIVINTQETLYLHFEESQSSQSPPIAPPQNCPILRITEADDFLLAKIEN